MRVIVTRPAAQAAAWVHALAERGVAAVALPLIDIAPPDDTRAVLQAWQALSTYRLVVFVSPNAAGLFFALKPSSARWPEGVLAASVGPGTTQALKQHGVPDEAIVEPAHDAAQFDSESLWQQLAVRGPWRGSAVLIVRGDGGRDWLADTLRAEGADVDFVAAYRRAPASLDGHARVVLHDALANPQEHVWFFSSSEAVQHLAHSQPDAAWSASRAIATHPRIAQRARDCGFGVIHEARPSLDSVVACIQSFAS